MTGPTNVGVVGGTSLVKRVEDTCERRGVRVVSGDVGDIVAANPTTVVAEGQSGVLDVVLFDPNTPILPIGAGPGLSSVPPDRVDAAVASVLAGEYRVHEPPTLLAAVDGAEPERALFDVALLTSGPAQISEFRVTHRERQVVQARADGVVVATPAGSHGYARAVGGPIVGDETAVVAVVPVAPFVTRQDRWVLPADDLEVSIERDEGAVTLFADDREAREVTSGSTVSISSGETATVHVVDASVAPLGA